MKAQSGPANLISSFLLAVGTGALGLFGIGSGSAGADAVSDFFHGRTLNLIIGTSIGNDYDFRGRLLARHLGRHIPGQPTIIAQNMPGVGGVKAANYMATIAPKDGTVLHMIMSNMMSAQAVGAQGVEFDARKFYWVGNTTSTPNVMNSWYTTGVTSVEQVKSRPLIVGAPTGTAGVTYATALNALAGTKFKIVTGYPGGNEVNIAMERGEVEGRASNSWASWKSTRPEWVASKKLNILVQVGLKRVEDLADVPLLSELATNELDRKLMVLLSTDTAVARSLITTPGVPSERVEALRRAFDATLKDPQFLAEAAKAQIDITAMSGEEAQEIAVSIVNTPPDVITRAKAVLGELLK